MKNSTSVQSPKTEKKEILTAFDQYNDTAEACNAFWASQIDFKPVVQQPEEKGCLARFSRWMRG